MASDLTSRSQQQPTESTERSTRDERVEEDERLYQSKMRLRVAVIFEPIFWVAIFFFAFLFQVPCPELVWLHLLHFIFWLYVFTTFPAVEDNTSTWLRFAIVGFILLGIFVLVLDIIAVLLRIFGCATQPFQDATFTLENLLRDCAIFWLVIFETLYIIYTAIVIGLLYVYRQEVVDYKQKKE